MTEIKIEQKKPVWPWLLLGLVVLALLLYFLVFPTKQETAAAAPPAPALTEGNKINQTVSEYVSFIQADTATMGPDHTYSTKALLMLIEATKAKAGEIGYEVKGDLDKAKDYANAITSDAAATTHADDIQKAAGILATVLQNMQQARYLALASEAAGVSTAAAAIKPDLLTLDQRQAVKTFFDKTAALLQKMN